jgi:hypothetical protein
MSRGGNHRKVKDVLLKSRKPLGGFRKLGIRKLTHTATDVVLREEGSPSRTPVSGILFLREEGSTSRTPVWGISFLHPRPCYLGTAKNRLRAPGLDTLEVFLVIFKLFALIEHQSPCLLVMVAFV